MKTTRLIQFVITAMTACALAFTAQAARGYNQYKYEDPTKHGGQYIPLTNEFVEVKQSGEFGTMYNPYALPTTLPHWLSNLCMHHLVTNAAGHSTLYVWNDKLAEHHKWGEVEYQGYRKGKFSPAWFLGTNTFYTENSPIGGENDDGSSVDTDGPYYKKVRLAQFKKTMLTEDKDTCLAQIKKAAEALTPAKGSDEEVGKNVTIAICELLMPHESTTTTVSDKCLNGATTPFTHANCTVISNLFYQLGYRHETTQNSCWENGQRLDGMSMAEVSKLCSESFEVGKDAARGPQFNGYWYAQNKFRPCNWSPEECISKVSEHYETGIDACIARLEPILASEWDGKYLLAASTNETAKAAKMEWPMFDDDVYLDRGDIGMMLFACKAVKTLDYMAQAYEIAGASSKPYSAEDPSYKDQAWTNRQQIIKWQGSWRESIRHRTWLKKDLTTYYNWRFERATCTFFHDTSSLLNSIKDPAMAAKAHQLFKEALAVYLDADAYIFGRKSATGHTIVGQRDNSTLHLFELFENDEDDEERGEKNAAGWRLLAEKAYESLNNDSTATIDLVDLGKKLNIHTKKNGAIDFSGLGEKADGKVTFNANMITNLTRHLVTDVDACVTTNGNYGLYAAHQIGDRWFPPEYHYWDGEATNYVKNSGGHNIPNPNVPTLTNRVSYTVFNLSKDTIDPTLGGVYPSCAFLRDIATMQARYPSAVPQEDLEDNVRTQQEFSRHLGTVTPCEIVTVRKEIAAGSTEELEDGKTYTAAATDKNGGVFKVGKGATLIGTNATFADNSAAKGGAIYNEGEVVMKGTFTLETAGDTIQNNGVLNWNLTGGNAGMLEGYDQLVNEGTLLVSIDDQTVAPVTIAKGDFANVDGKDTFTITNVTTGTSVTLKIGEGVRKIGDKYWELKVVGDELKLIVSDPVKLSDVAIIDKTTEPWKTNATAVVKLGDQTIEPEADGSFNVPANYPLEVVYEAANYGEDDGYMFGPGMKNKTIVIENGIARDMTFAEAYPAGKPTVQLAWVDSDGEAGGREFALDTRERIVVTDLNDILPIAYSTNCWDKYPEANWTRIYTNATASGQFFRSKRENGYEDWMPQAGVYGKYDFAQKWSRQVGTQPSIDYGTNYATICYTTYFPLTWATSVGGTIAVTNEGAAVASNDKVLGYSYLKLAATPEAHYEFKGWSATAGGVPVEDGAFGDKSESVTTFEMPTAATELKADFVWQSTFTEKKTVDKGEIWEVFEGDDYQRGITNNGTIVWKPGTTNEQGKASYLSNFGQLQNGADGKLLIEFDKALTNGVYELAGNLESDKVVGKKFQITNGAQTNECEVVNETSIDDVPWVYVGAKRFKLYISGTAPDNCLKLIVEPGIPMALDFAASPVDGGTIAASTNGAAITSGTKIYPSEKVTVVATTNRYWQFNGWTGVDAAGNALTFDAPSSETTFFTMPETNVTVTANFIVSEAYQAETAQAITNAAQSAIDAVNAMNLSDDEKAGYADQIKKDRDEQVAAVVGANTPADVAGALDAANTAFDATKKAAQAYADQTWAITPVVAYTNIAGVVTVTNESQARLSVEVTAITNLYWQFNGWTGVDAAGNALTFDAPSSETTFFTMPETNVTITANFIVSEAYQVETAQAITNAAQSAIDAVNAMNLSDAEKAGYADQIKKDRDAQVAAVVGANTPADVAGALDAANTAFDATKKAAQAYADLEWTITAIADPNDAGTVNVSTNRSQARKTITVTAIPAENWMFACWTELDPTNGIVTVETQGKATLVFEMPETNVNLVAKFMLDEAYRAEGHVAITNAAITAKATVAAMNLSDTDKDRFVQDILAAETTALESLKAAKSPTEVEATIAVADKAFRAIVVEAQVTADREWAIAFVVEPTAGGSVIVTNRSQARLAVPVAAVTNLHCQFVGWTGKDAAGRALKFADPAKATTTFTMPETNVVLTATFTVDEVYRAELTKAVNDKYAATTNAIEALRYNRLTGVETDKALAEAAKSHEQAIADIAKAQTPSDAKAAQTTADTALTKIGSDAKSKSDAKPYNLLIAEDFAAIADEGSYDSATGKFTVNGIAYQKDVNAFNTFRDAYTAPDTAFTTDVHVYGSQTIEDDVTNLGAWTLDIHDSVITIGVDSGNKLYASVTNTLATIYGTGAIVFGKAADDETKAVQSALADVLAAGTAVTVKAADVTPEKKIDPVTQEEIVEVKIDEAVKPEGEAAVLPAVATDEGNVKIVIASGVAYDAVVAGKIEATNGTVTIMQQAPEQALTVTDAIVAKDVCIDNYGHFDADVTATAGIVITNRSMNTIVGDYSAASIELTGIDFAAISNVSFAADSIRLTGANALSGPLAIVGVVATNDGVFAWNVTGGAKAAFLEDFATLADGPNAAYAIIADVDQARGDYELAANAATAADKAFRLVQNDAEVEIVVGGESVCPGDTRSYALAVKNGKLVLTVTDAEARVSFAAIAVSGVEGESVEIVVKGGSMLRPSQATVSLQRGTLTSYKAYLGEKKVSFPLVLNWEAGDREPKTITIETKAATKVEVDKFLTLQLGSGAAAEIVSPDVCTVTVRDSITPTADTGLYVRALAWPANGGKVSGSGAIKTDKYGAVKTSKTLTAKANKWAMFAGWYAAKADNPNEIDTNNCLTVETKFKVGKGTDYTNGTYFAYFTDVTAVAAVNQPDATAADAKGVAFDAEAGAYVGTVGVKFALPIGSDDEDATLTVSGLPSGLKYNKKAGIVEGVPTKASEKAVKVIAKNAAGKHTATFDFEIGAMPANAIGTWNGIVRELEDPEDGTHAGFGTVQFTAGKTGALSAKVMTREAGTKSFSVKGYDYIDANTFGVAITNKSGEVFTAVLSLTNDWKTAQLVGTVTGGALTGAEVKFAAIRNAFDKKDGNADALSLLESYKGEYKANLLPENDGAAAGTVTFKVMDSGKVQVKAKTASGTYSASCAGAFRALPDAAAWPKGSAAIQLAVRSGKQLWATDTVLGSDDTLTGLSCEYDSDGDDTHAKVVGEQ